jgi:hypothetical protein
MVQEGTFDQGTLVSGKLHNQRTGKLWEGVFIRGLLHGEGAMQLADGRNYKGEFRKGLPNGRCALTNTNSEGWVWEGTFITVDGHEPVLHGQDCKIKCPDGTVWKGEYDNGTEIGRTTIRFAW